MSKKKKDKEEAINTWIPIGVMIGTVIGMVISFVFDNFLYLAVGSAGGLLLGTMIGSIIDEDDTEIEFKKRKKK